MRNNALSTPVNTQMHTTILFQTRKRVAFWYYIHTGDETMIANLYALTVRYTRYTYNISDGCMVNKQMRASNNHSAK